MTHSLIAEFDDVCKLKNAIDDMNESGRRVLDAFTPYPVEGLAEKIFAPRARIRPVMLASGLATAGFFYFLQWYSATIAFPFDAGNRPLHSWPVFLLAPFEIGVFGAALGGVIAWLFACGLPRLHHPVFDVHDFDRATRDRFFLLVGSTGDARDIVATRRRLEDRGALSVAEARGT